MGCQSMGMVIAQVRGQNHGSEPCTLTAWINRDKPRIRTTTGSVKGPRAVKRDKNRDFSLTFAWLVLDRESQYWNSWSSIR